MTDEPVAETGFLRGRVAVVTGGASGIGRACALALAGAGAAVAVGSLLGRGPNSTSQGKIVHLPGPDALEEPGQRKA
mgnify:CR=1 FL=1